VIVEEPLKFKETLNKTRFEPVGTAELTKEIDLEKIGETVNLLEQPNKAADAAISSERSNFPPPESPITDPTLITAESKKTKPTFQELTTLHNWGKRNPEQTKETERSTAPTCDFPAKDELEAEMLADESNSDESLAPSERIRTIDRRKKDESLCSFDRPIETEAP
jgi:hypothetical protein